MTPFDALTRTILLMRSNLLGDVTDNLLVNTLFSTQVVFIADRRNVATPEGQHALVTAINLVARSGARCFLNAPNVALFGGHAPLNGAYLVDALVSLVSDLIPGRELEVGMPDREYDLAILIGDTNFSGKAKQVINVSADLHYAGIAASGTRWKSTGNPFGAMAAAGLAAVEGYKAAMRKVQSYAAPGPFDEFFAPVNESKIDLLPIGIDLTGTNLGEFDFISGGAIAHSALYALARIPDAVGACRIIDDDINDISNINRYALLRRNGLGQSKVGYLKRCYLGNISLRTFNEKYGTNNQREMIPLSDQVLMGVDNIKSRIEVQRAMPNYLAIGATEGYMAMTSVHTDEVACAYCVHGGEEFDANEIAPTAAFVSHWAGLCLAAAFVQKVRGLKADLNPHQVTQLMTLQLKSNGGIWLMRGFPRKGCPFLCDEKN